MMHELEDARATENEEVRKGQRADHTEDGDHDKGPAPALDTTCGTKNIIFILLVVLALLPLFSPSLIAALKL